MRNVDCLRYLLYTTRPDISFYVERSKESWEATIRTTSRIPIGGDNDSNHRVDPDDGESATGKIYYVDKSPITWCSSEQKTVELSSCEAENMAGMEAMKHALYHLIPECDEYDLIEVQRILESERRIDILTKPLRRLKYKDMTYLVGVQEVTQVNIKFKGEIHLIITRLTSYLMPSLLIRVLNI